MGTLKSECGTLKFDLRVERNCISLQKKKNLIEYEFLNVTGRFELAPSDTKKRKTSSIVDEKVIADKNLKSTATSNTNQATAASKETALEDWWIGKLGISNLKSSVTKEDLYELFGSIGEVCTSRLNNERFSANFCYI